MLVTAQACIDTWAMMVPPNAASPDTQNALQNALNPYLPRVRQFIREKSSLALDRAGHQQNEHAECGNGSIGHMATEAAVQSAPEAPERLGEIADQLRKGTKAEATVRQLLGFFSAQRRGYYIVQYIRNALDSLGIITEPDFESVWIDSPIEFRLRSEQAVPPSNGGIPAEVGEVP